MSASKSASKAALIVTVMHPTSRLREGLPAASADPRRSNHGKSIGRSLHIIGLSLIRVAVRLLLAKVGEPSYRPVTLRRLVSLHEKLNVCFDCRCRFIIF